MEPMTSLFDRVSSAGGIDAYYNAPDEAMNAAWDRDQLNYQQADQQAEKDRDLQLLLAQLREAQGGGRSSGGFKIPGMWNTNLGGGGSSMGVGGGTSPIMGAEPEKHQYGPTRELEPGSNPQDSITMQIGGSAPGSADSAPMVARGMQPNPEHDQWQQRGQDILRQVMSFNTKPPAGSVTDRDRYRTEESAMEADYRVQLAEASKEPDPVKRARLINSARSVRDRGKSGLPMGGYGAQSQQAFGGGQNVARKALVQRLVDSGMSWNEADRLVSEEEGA